MEKKVTQSDIEKVQESIEPSRIQLDKRLLLIEDLDAQIETMRQEREARKQARREKRK